MNSAIVVAGLSPVVLAALACYLWSHNIYFNNTLLRMVLRLPLSDYKTAGCIKGAMRFHFFRVLAYN